MRMCSAEQLGSPQPPLLARAPFNTPLAQQRLQTLHGALPKGMAV